MPASAPGQRRQLASLPRLPVPPLRQTLELFLKNLRLAPLSKRPKRTPKLAFFRPLSSPESLAEAEKLVADLAGGVGGELQAHIQRKAETTENWVRRRNQMSKMGACD